MTDIQELPQAEAVKKLTREQISDLRNSFEVWQQDYDPIHDKEQHDMFALGVVAMNEMLAAMDGEVAERREWMARGVEAFGKEHSCEYHSIIDSDTIRDFAVLFARNIRTKEIE